MEHFLSLARRVIYKDSTKIILEYKEIIIVTDHYKRTIKTTHESGRVKDNKAERLSEL